MNKIIYKYPIGLRSTLELPKNAEFLFSYVQRGKIVLYFKQNLGPHEIEPRKFIVVGTGHIFDEDGLHYLATVIDGEFVWHIFEDIGE